MILKKKFRKRFNDDNINVIKKKNKNYFGCLLFFIISMMIVFFT